MIQLNSSIRPQAAAEFLGISPATLWRWAKERRDFPKARKLSSRALPMMRWSCTVIPMTSAAATMRFVMVMSACEGVGSPDGWLCTIHLVRITC